MKIINNIIHKYKWTALGLLVTAVVMTPIYLIAIFGFENVHEMFHVPPYLFPPSPTLKTYATTFTDLVPYMKNSFIISSGCLFITLLVAPLAAYSLAHFNLRIGKYIIFMLVLTQMFPAVMLAIPLFLIYSNVGLLNTYLGLMLVDATLTIPFCILILSAYIRSVPFEMVEAATIDGASFLTTLLRIVLPIAKSGIATAGIFGFLFAWADFIYALTLTTKETIRPISVALFKYKGLYGIQWNNLMAGGFIFSMLPLVIIIIAGKLIVTGLTAGALKQ